MVLTIRYSLGSDRREAIRCKQNFLRHGRELRVLEDGLRRGDDAVHLVGQRRGRVSCGRPDHVMRKTVALAKENGVAVGVHPGYRDLVGFGRREIGCLAGRDPRRAPLPARRPARVRPPLRHGGPARKAPRLALHGRRPRRRALARHHRGHPERRPRPPPVLHAVLRDLRARREDGPAGGVRVLRRPGVQRRWPDRLHPGRYRGAGPR